MLALLTPSSRAERVVRAALEVTRPSGWLTLGVPMLLSRCETLALLGAVAPSFSDLERSAHARLDAHLETVADRGRVCGLVLEIPVLRSLVERVRAAEHDLVVAPAGVRELPLVCALRAATGVRVLRVAGAV